MNMNLGRPGNLGIGRLEVNKQVATKNSNNGESLSAGVEAFKHGASPSTVRNSVLSKLDQFENMPAARENLVNAQDASGGNMLHQVGSFENQGGDVRKLVHLGVDINAKDKNGMTPLFYAVSQKDNRTDLIGSLLEAGADPNSHNEKTGKSVLLAVLLTSPPVENLLVLLQNPNIEIPAKIKLSTGLEMDFSRLIEKKYKDPSALQRVNAVLSQKSSVSRP